MFGFIAEAPQCGVVGSDEGKPFGHGTCAYLVSSHHAAITTCKRSARALFRRQVPTPSNTPRPHPRSLIPNCGRYQHVFHPDRNKSSTPTGTQAALIHTDSPFVPSTIPRGNWPMNTVECRSGSRRAERGRPPRPPCEVSSHPRTGFAMPGRT